MKKTHISVMPAPGLLNIDLKGLQSPSDRLFTALKTLLIILAPVFKVVAYFVSLVLIFATMFALFVMAATISKPENPRAIKAIYQTEGGTYGTEHLPQPPRI